MKHQTKHLGIQIVRRCTQLFVIWLMLYVIFLSLYAHYHAARALEDQVQANSWKAKVLAANDRRVSAKEDPQEYLDGYKGTLWSMRLAGYDLTDPLAVAEVIATSKTIYTPLLLTALIPVIVTLLMGRVFCSWMCPAGLLFEMTGKLRKLLKVAEIPAAEIKFSHANKYVLLVVGLAVSAVVGLPMFALIYPPAVVSRLAHAWIFGTSMTGMLILTGLVVLFEIFISPRWWCRTVCPGAALYGLIGWPRLLRVKLISDRCNGCKKCEPVCELGLDPVLQASSIECDNCGVCLRHCPDKALVYTIALPTIGKQHRHGQPDRAKGKLPVVTTSVALLAVFALPQSALGHHILGLPHYSYKENYPQVPTLEYPAATGPYDILMTSYPGKPVPGEPAAIAFYIRNRESGQPYGQPVTVRALQTTTFGRNKEVYPSTQHYAFDNLHKCNVTFADDGEYIVELTMNVEGQTEVIPFLMVAGEPTATVSIVIAIAGSLLVFLVVVRAIKIKRDRRRKMQSAGKKAKSALQDRAFQAQPTPESTTLLPKETTGKIT